MCSFITNYKCKAFISKAFRQFWKHLYIVIGILMPMMCNFKCKFYVVPILPRFSKFECIKYSFSKFTFTCTLYLTLSSTHLTSVEAETDTPFCFDQCFFDLSTLLTVMALEARRRSRSVSTSSVNR